MKKEESQLQRVEQQALTIPSSEYSPVNMGALFEAAVKQGSAMEVIKELRQMESDIQNRRAKAMFDEDMCAFQDECPVILKEKGVKTNSGQLAYKYAPIEVIEVKIRPLLRRHGFSHTFDTDTTSAAGWVIAKCIVKHKGGHENVSVAKFPIGTKTQIMSDTQVFASALTFANRRALMNAYGLVLAGEDMDGATGKLKGESPSAIGGSGDERQLKKELVDLTREWHGAKGYALDDLAKGKMLQFLVDEAFISDNESLNDLTTDNLKAIISKIKTKFSK